MALAFWTGGGAVRCRSLQTAAVAFMFPFGNCPRLLAAGAQPPTTQDSCSTVQSGGSKTRARAHAGQGRHCGMAENQDGQSRCRLHHVARLRQMAPRQHGGVAALTWDGAGAPSLPVPPPDERRGTRTSYCGATQGPARRQEEGSEGTKSPARSNAISKERGHALQGRL